MTTEMQGNLVQVPRTRAVMTPEIMLPAIERFSQRFPWGYMKTRLFALLKEVHQAPAYIEFFRSRFGLEVSLMRVQFNWMQAADDDNNIRSDESIAAADELMRQVAPTTFDLDQFAYAFEWVRARINTLEEPARSRLLNGWDGRLRGSRNQDQGLTPFAAELSLLGLFTAEGYRIGFNDLADNGEVKNGSFDYLIERDGIQTEIECKRFSIDTGRRLNSYKLLELANYLLRDVQSHADLGLEPGMVLKIVTKQLGEVKPKKLRDTLDNGLRRYLDHGEADTPLFSFRKFSLSNESLALLPEGGLPTDEAEYVRLQQSIFADIEGKHAYRFFAFTEAPNVKPFFVVFEADKPDSLTETVWKLIKKSKGQFSGCRRAELHIFFEGLSPAELDFLRSSTLTSVNKEYGLNPRFLDEKLATREDLRHVQKVVIRSPEVVTYPSPDNPGDSAVILPCFEIPNRCFSLPRDMTDLEETKLWNPDWLTLDPA